jgi:hypothetical protein
MKVQLVNNGGLADNTSIDISSGHIEIGTDPVDFTLQLRKPMSTADFSGTAEGRFTLDHIKQFVKLDPGTGISGILNADLGFSGNKTVIDKGEYDKLNINGKVIISNLKYVSKDYPKGISVSAANLEYIDKMVLCKNFNGSYLNSDFTGKGVFDNLIGFIMRDQRLTGEVNITADKINLNDWMGTDTTTTAATASSSAPFVVPANIDMTINAKAGKVKYDKVDYNNINGTLVVSDETVKLKDVKTEALGGTMNLNGSYSTKTNKKDPAININYDVKDLDIQKTFYAFNTVQKLMPIAQFLGGKLHSQLTMTGNLNGNMMPDLKTLSGKGNFLLIEGLLKKFAPLEKLATTLQIDELSAITIKDVKNYIEFANGKVLVKPFNLKIKDIEMQIGGLHGFDQSIDYAMQMKVPRKYFGKEGNTILDNLTTRATNKGISVKLGDMVDLNISMSGSLTNPVIKTELKQVAGDAIKDMKQQAADFAKAKADTVRQTVTDTLASVKKQAVNDLKSELRDKVFGTKDSAKTNNMDSTKDRAQKTFKNTLNSFLNKKKKPATNTTKKE